MIVGPNAFLGKVNLYLRNHCLVRDIGLIPYDRCLVAMIKEVELLASSLHEPISQCWLVEHYPVFTAGISASPKHFSSIGQSAQKIPFVFTDRGGQITYHGPGQLVIYLLVDVRRLFCSAPKLFVSCIEKTLINIFRSMDIDVHLKPGYPGVYISDLKLVSLGFKFRRGWSYHGIAINVDMDLSPFSEINPCGSCGLKMTQLKDVSTSLTTVDILDVVVDALTASIVGRGGVDGN